MKSIMCQENIDLQDTLKGTLANYGISFSIARNFRGAPVQGYLSRKNDGCYQMVLTIRGAFADIFWFSLFHEIGHIVNGDVGKDIKFIDNGSDDAKEKAADRFASDMLLSPDSYQLFTAANDFSLESIRQYAKSQHVMPYIVIGRLQKEQRISWRAFSGSKQRYHWRD